MMSPKGDSAMGARHQGCVDISEPGTEHRRHLPPALGRILLATNAGDSSQMLDTHPPTRPPWPKARGSWDLSTSPASTSIMHRSRLLNSGTGMAEAGAAATRWTLQ